MGDPLISFLQALTKISDLTYMTREDGPTHGEDR